MCTEKLLIISIETDLFGGATGMHHEPAGSPYRQAQSACMTRSEPTLADVSDFLQRCQEAGLLFHALWLCMHLFTGLLTCLGHHTEAATLYWFNSIKTSALWKSMSHTLAQVPDRARQKFASVWPKLKAPAADGKRGLQIQYGQFDVARGCFATTASTHFQNNPRTLKF